MWDIGFSIVGWLISWSSHLITSRKLAKAWALLTCPSILSVQHSNRTAKLSHARSSLPQAFLIVELSELAFGPAFLSKNCTMEAWVADHNCSQTHLVLYTITWWCNELQVGSVLVGKWAAYSRGVIWRLGDVAAPHSTVPCNNLSSVCLAFLGSCDHRTLYPTLTELPIPHCSRNVDPNESDFVGVADGTGSEVWAAATDGIRDCETWGKATRSESRAWWLDVSVRHAGQHC